MGGLGRELLAAAVVWLGGVCAGSVPFGLLLSRAAGLGDIRRIGSGSIGATNVLRTGRKDVALLTLLLDGGKGAVAVLVAEALAGPGWGTLAGLAAVAGHCFSFWVGGNGGKGVATGVGVLLAWCWPAALAACAAWGGMVYMTRISSAGALSACAVAPVAMLAACGTRYALYTAFAVGIVLWRHKANIARLRAGTEPRIGQRA